MPKAPIRRKGKTNQAAGSLKAKVNTKGKHVETRDEAAEHVASHAVVFRGVVLPSSSPKNDCVGGYRARGSRSKKERPITNASSWVTNKLLYYSRHNFCNSRFRERSRPGNNSTTNRFMELFYERFAWHECSPLESLPWFFTVFSVIFSFSVLQRLCGYL